jgi:hypothetical protein
MMLEIPLSYAGKHFVNNSIPLVFPPTGMLLFYLFLKQLMIVDKSTEQQYGY